MIAEGYEVMVVQLVTPSRELAAIFDDHKHADGGDSVWLEPVYAMALIQERFSSEKGDFTEQQAIVPVCDYGTGEIFLGPAVDGYVGVIPIAGKVELPARCSPKSSCKLWQRIGPLLQRSRESVQDGERGKVIDLVQRSLLSFNAGIPRPTAAKVAQVERRAASLFVSAGRVLCKQRTDLRLASAVERVEAAYSLQPEDERTEP